MKLEKRINKILGDYIKEYNTGIRLEAAARRGWGNWEIVREFTQNALDAVGQAEIISAEDGIVISDRGGGFDATVLTVGESTKNPECDRGQFGDGMKYAMASALLCGYEVYIHSKRYIYMPYEKPIEYVTEKGIVKKPVMHVKQYEARERIDGTDVYIVGWRGKTYRERFIFYTFSDLLDCFVFDGENAYELLHTEEVDLSYKCDRHVVYHRQILKPKRGHKNAIFVKDVYVQDLENGLYSYNLVDVKLDVGRNIPQDWTVQEEISRVWSGCKNITLLTEFLKKLAEYDCYERRVSWQYGSWKISRNKDVWIEALKRAFPKAVKNGELKIAYVRDNAEAQLLLYYAPEYSIVNLPDSLMRALCSNKIIPRAADVIKTKRAQNYKIVPDSSLTAKQRKVLRRIRQIHTALYRYYKEVGVPDIIVDAILELKNTCIADAEKIAMERLDEMPKYKIKAIEHSDKSVLGVHVGGLYRIGITPQRLEHLKGAIETYTHELTHAFIGDDEPAEENRRGSLFVKVQSNLILDIMAVIANKRIRELW